MRNNEQGRSMIEMLGVLAIVGVLSVGGIAGYSKAMNKFKTNKVIDQINMVSTNIRTLYSSQRTFEGLDNVVAVKAGIIPGEMFDATDGSSISTVTNAFNGKMEVGAVTNIEDNDNRAFVVIVDGIPASSCTTIATTDWGSDAGSGLIAMSIGNDIDTVKGALNQTKDDLGSGDRSLAVMGSDEHGFPYKMSDASASCGGSGFATIGWKYE